MQLLAVFDLNHHVENNGAFRLQINLNGVAARELALLVLVLFVFFLVLSRVGPDVRA